MKTVYIIGIGRSGTTLLLSLLGNHPDINILPENYFLTFFYRPFRNKTKFSPTDFEKVNTFNKAFHILQPIVGFDYEDDFNLTHSTGLNGNYEEFCQQIYSHYQHRLHHSEKAKIIINKNPVNTLFLEEILSIDPKAKFIFISRDPRANALSRKQSVHIYSPSPLYNAYRWNYFTKRAIKFSSKNKDLVFQIRYEDLVQSPENQLKEILDFLGLPQVVMSTDQSLERQSISEEDTTIKSDRWQKKYNDLSAPVFTKRIEAWKNELTQKEIKSIDSICSKYGEALGYRKMYDTSISFSLKTLIKGSPHMVLLRLQMLKNNLTELLPLSYKIVRFRKFVDKVERKRNSSQKS